MATNIFGRGEEKKGAKKKNDRLALEKQELIMNLNIGSKVSGWREYNIYTYILSI